MPGVVSNMARLIGPGAYHQDCEGRWVSSRQRHPRAHRFDCAQPVQSRTYHTADPSRCRRLFIHHKSYTNVNADSASYGVRERESRPIRKRNVCFQRILSIPIQKRFCGWRLHQPPGGPERRKIPLTDNPRYASGTTLSLAVSLASSRP
jgi:hypothetical protein